MIVWLQKVCIPPLIALSWRDFWFDLLSIQKVDFETLPPSSSFPTEFLMTYLGMGKGISCNHTYNLISHKPPLIMSSLGGHL